MRAMRNDDLLFLFDAARGYEGCMPDLALAEPASGRSGRHGHDIGMRSPSDIGSNGGAASVRAAEGLVTLVEGRTFCLSAANGDIVPGLTQGLFVLDTRVLSRWELRVNGQPVEGLSVDVRDPF